MKYFYSLSILLFLWCIQYTASSTITDDEANNWRIAAEQADEPRVELDKYPMSHGIRNRMANSKHNSKSSNPSTCIQQILFIRGGTGTGGFLEGGTDDQLSDITDFSTNNRNRGWGEFATTLEGEGYQLTQLIENPNVPIDLTAINISQYGCVVFGSNNATYSTASIDELENYVRSGGSALFISDANFGSNWGDAPSSDQGFLNRFGWTMNQDQGTYALTTTDFLDPNHPIFDNVTAFDGEGVSPITLTDPNVNGVNSTILANAKNVVRRNTGMGRGPSEVPTANDAALIIATVDNGRIAGHFDRNTFFNLNGAGTNINRLSNMQYAKNLINWLTNCNTTCQVGASCDDGDDCTINDTFDANCNCIGTFSDMDMDGVCDADDICAGASDLPLSISIDPSTDSTYRAVDSIFSDARISAGLAVTYQAGRVIVLGAGFEAVNGSNFLAEIEGCTANMLPSSISSFSTSKVDHAVEKRETIITDQHSVAIYPNPFSTQTTIEYELTANAVVQISILDLTGRVVEVLLPKQQQRAGSHQVHWLPTDQRAALHLMRIQIGEQSLMKKVLLSH